MASNSKQTKLIRARKAKPNKINTKVNLKRVQKNSEILRELKAKDSQ